MKVSSVVEGTAIFMGIVQKLNCSIKSAAEFV